MLHVGSTYCPTGLAQVTEPAWGGAQLQVPPEPQVQTDGANV